MVQIDNVVDFLSLHSCIDSLGIVHRHSCPYAHHQMGKIDRQHCYLIDSTLTMMNYARLPTLFWDCVVMTAMFIYIQSPIVLMKGISLFEKLFGRSPDNGIMRVFDRFKGFFMLTTIQEEQIWQQILSSCFPKYPATDGGYVCLNVVFFEDDFGLNSSFSKSFDGDSSLDYSSTDIPNVIMMHMNLPVSGHPEMLQSSAAVPIHTTMQSTDDSLISSNYSSNH